MSSGSVDGDVGDENDESSQTASEDAPEDNRPKDPVLFLVDSFERSFQRIDDL